MLQAWAMRGLRPRPPAGGTAQDELMGLLDEAGFTSVVATNCEQDYDRYLHLGDHLSAASVIESVSDEKGTALGPGHFITTRIVYTDQHGQRVAPRLQLRHQPPPPGAGLRLPAGGRPDRVGGRDPARVRPGRRGPGGRARGHGRGGRFRRLRRRAHPSRVPSRGGGLMDFTFTEEQEAVRDLAGRVFGDRATVDRVKDVERSPEPVDRELWGELARTGLLALCLPEEAGGS